MNEIIKLDKPLEFRDTAKKFYKKIVGLNYSFGHMTTRFGYTIYGGKGYNTLPGIHPAIDTIGRNLKSPLNFKKSSFTDHSGIWYGSDVEFFHEYNFKFKICHMIPGEIKVLNQLQNNFPVNENEEIGPPGNYGGHPSHPLTGRHYHIEFESWPYNRKGWKENCEILDWILYFRYGDNSLIMNPEKLIRNITSKCRDCKNWNDKQKQEDFDMLCRKKSIVFVNEYQMKIMCRGSLITTLYNPAAIFHNNWRPL